MTRPGGPGSMRTWLDDSREMFDDFDSASDVESEYRRRSFRAADVR